MTGKITQLFDIDFSTVRTLNEVSSDTDDNGILSAGDTVNGAEIYQSDFESPARLEEFLSQAANRRVEILTTGNGFEHFLAYSYVSDFNKLCGVFRIAKWGECANRDGTEYECVSDDEKYDPNYDHSQPNQDRTRDRLLYAAAQYPFHASESAAKDRLLAGCLAAVTDAKTKEDLEKRMSEEFIASPSSGSLGASCDYAYVQQSYEDFFESRTAALWSAWRLTGDDLKATDFNSHQLETAKKVKALADEKTEQKKYSGACP